MRKALPGWSLFLPRCPTPREPLGPIPGYLSRSPLSLVALSLSGSLIDQACHFWGRPRPGEEEKPGKMLFWCACRQGRESWVARATMPLRLFLFRQTLPSFPIARGCPSNDSWIAGSWNRTNVRAKAILLSAMDLAPRISQKRPESGFYPEPLRFSVEQQRRPSLDGFAVVG